MYLLNLFIAEPLTAITDYLLTVAALFFFLRLRKKAENKEYIKSWSYFFLFTGISTFFGGLAHSFHLKEGTTYLEIWISMQLFGGLAIFFAQKGGLESECHPKGQKLFVKLTGIQLILFTLSVLIFFSFKTVVINSVVTLSILLVLYFPRELLQWNYRYLVTIGILTSFLTALVNIKKIILAPWFNQHDLSHVIMYLSLLLIYSGIKYKHNNQSLFTK